MKYGFIICASLIFGFNYTNGQVQKVLFEKKEVCENNIKFKNSFSGNSLKKISELFDEDKIDFIKAKTKCSSIKNNIDKVYLGTSIIEICYKNQHLKVYDKLLELCKQKDWKNNRITLDYFKPGKIVILNASQSIIKIISYNFCSDPKKQSELVESIIKSNNFHKMFYVECGINNLKELTYK